MRVNGNPERTIGLASDGWAVEVVDQTQLPHRFAKVRLASVEEAAAAIRSMTVRGAPLIGATAAYGVALALRQDPSDAGLEAAQRALLATRPTAVNLRTALRAAVERLRPIPAAERMAAAYAHAAAVCEQDVAANHALGQHGLALLRAAAERHPARPVQVLTHCNAGWLATVDWGTATAPVYLAHREGIPVHVWVTETRPRNQGALTAWELGEEGVPHTLVVDNAAGHLLRLGKVSLVLVGTDRTTASGDVCNKIGTYLLATAARDAGVPFYAAVPGSSIDWEAADSDTIPIEERDGDEVTHVAGKSESGMPQRVRIAPVDTPVVNPGFDVTPARLVTALVTERGVTEPSADGLRRLYPERHP